jgi:hypothetical protein
MSEQEDYRWVLKKGTIARVTMDADYFAKHNSES